MCTGFTARRLHSATRAVVASGGWLNASTVPHAQWWPEPSSLPPSTAGHPGGGTDLMAAHADATPVQLADFDVAGAGACARECSQPLRPTLMFSDPSPDPSMWPWSSGALVFWLWTPRCQGCFRSEDFFATPSQDPSLAHTTRAQVMAVVGQGGFGKVRPPLLPSAARSPPRCRNRLRASWVPHWTRPRPYTWTTPPQ